MAVAADAEAMEPRLSANALRVLEYRYLRRDEGGQVIETPRELFLRVATTIAGVEERFGGDVTLARRRFYAMMAGLEFLPNSPTLMNAGLERQQLSACFVLPVADSLEGIFQALKHTAVIHQTGGGTGFSFSRLRRRGDVVKSTMGVASGPVSFMRIFDTATDVVKQGGRRRGANMGVLRVDHPDIEDFVRCKADESAFRNFNISVAVTEAFMEAVRADREYDLVNPRTGRPGGHRRARDVWRLIAEMAWKTGDPGVIFIDRVNATNPTPRVGVIESTNPCGEQPLLPYESCNLGSLNLARLVVGEPPEADLDWGRLDYLVGEGVRFLDNVIDANEYPVPEIEQVTKANRKIGLGVMGFADMLIQLGVPYDAPEALDWARRVMSRVESGALKASEELARQRGAFPNFPESLWEQRGSPPLRNATLTTVAPTGTIAILADCSASIEPIYAVAYRRHALDGEVLPVVNEAFVRIAKRRGFHSEALLERVTERGSVCGVPEVPDEVQGLFATAYEVPAEAQVRMQAAFQEHTHNAVSKTLNLPAAATVEDVLRIYDFAYDLGCKGVTVYRQGSKAGQVLEAGA